LRVANGERATIGRQRGAGQRVGNRVGGDQFVICRFLDPNQFIS
jgi:hypothetical protein